MLKAIWECVSGSQGEDGPVSDEEIQQSKAEGAQSGQEIHIANQVIAAMQDAEKTGEELRGKVAGVVEISNWTESLAKAVLAGLDEGVKKGMQMKGPLKEAFDKAVAAAVDFASEHPVYTTVIALGILVVLLPWVIEALGFGELGPIEGTFAARWQSKYLGYVPKRSLFSFFQRLGMVWRHSVIVDANLVREKW